MENFHIIVRKRTYSISKLTTEVIYCKAKRMVRNGLYSYMFVGDAISLVIGTSEKTLKVEGLQEKIFINWNVEDLLPDPSQVK